MTRFVFEAVGPTGALVRGSLNASTRSFALEEIIASGQVPISIREASDRASISARLAIVFFWRSFDYRLLLYELGVLLRAGMPMDRALIILIGIAPNASHSMKVTQILDRVRGGNSLSQALGAMERDIPAYIPRLLAAGEASGRLADTIVRLSQSLARAAALRAKLISGLTYPAILVLAVLGVLWVIFGTVLPRLVPIFEDAGTSLPEATAALLNIDLFLNAYGWLFFLVLVALGALVISAVRQPRIRLSIDRLLLESKGMLDLPSRYEAARFCRLLQTLLEGGLSLENAMALSSGSSSNSWFRLNLGRAQVAVAEGQPLRSALSKSAALPQLVIEFAAVGEETGRLAIMMGEVASLLDSDVEKRLDRLTALVVPAATLLLGALVSGIMAAVVSGILAVNDITGE